MRRLSIALAAASIVLAGPALAGPATDAVTIDVRTSDLDLTDSADQARLDRRIDTAIDQACRTGGRDLSSRRAESACRAALKDAATPGVELAITRANTRHFATLDLDPGA
ncbi:UrcA family protein [Aurantiacibacter spongiae]|uniref:UrcA family protein n=1 Tax=Aurantiacibacter spongiae TaxID=2488860 RepID=A0A3N5CMZ7_9SPHN|nr:UrcA family protein [Aurantiacibacter spongiae]RPF70314.1 UrcA family protein [Aurantiacibacter spongiae]